MTSVEIIFWLSVAVLFYCYVGYGALLLVLNHIKRVFRPFSKANEYELLPVTLVVAAYNEETILAQKIRNTLEIDYPSHLFHIIFITDGSSDGSADLVGQHEFITLLHQAGRQGKSAALKRAMRFVETPIVIFSDANAMLNSHCIRAIVRHYHDERVGGVAGEKKICASDHSSVIGQTEGLYWKYESFMKKQDSDFNTVVGAAGELFSIRTELFQLSDEQLILDDFAISMQVCLDGYKIKYEPNAYAIEYPSASLCDEEKRKTRIAAGGYQCIGHFRYKLQFMKCPLLTFQYFSRRILRWVASPVLIALIFLTDGWLVAGQQGVIFNYLLIAQVIFYLLAFVGRLFMAAGWRMGILNAPFYFLFMNYCLVKGFLNYRQGCQTVLWEKSMREAMK